MGLAASSDPRPQLARSPWTDRAKLVLVVLTGWVLVAGEAARAAPEKPVPVKARAALPSKEAIASLSADYNFGVAGRPLKRCVVTLEPHAGLHVKVAPHCRRRFPFLGRVTRWSSPGGGTVELYAGERETGHFSPVQDGTGVFIRGGFSGERRVFELRRIGR